MKFKIGVREKKKQRFFSFYSRLPGKGKGKRVLRLFERCDRVMVMAINADGRDFATMPMATQRRRRNE